MSEITIEISAGELFDRLSILEIKKQRITDEKKSVNVVAEYNATYDLYESYMKTVHEDKIPLLNILRSRLTDINTIIWDIEDNIRSCELKQDFGPKFIGLARGVYFNNDDRAKYKREINALVNAKFIEEKSYTQYTRS